MMHLSNKSKHYGLIALKVLILTATFWFIFDRLADTNNQTISAFTNQMKDADLLYILLFFFMAILNWAMEIRKWLLLVQPLQQISFKSSMQQCLASLTASLWTPNRLGEYGVKPLFYRPEKRKKVMVLMFVSNTAQMFVTILFGIPGLIYFLNQYGVAVSLWKPIAIFILVLLLIVSGYYFRKTQLIVKGLSLQKIIKYVKNIPGAIKLQVFLLSALRYLVFASAFYLILLFLGVELDLFKAIPLITAMYLLASVLPTFIFLDVAIKGGVAIWIFSFAGVEELPVLGAATAMWVLNFVIPALIGTYYVAKFKPVAA